MKAISFGFVLLLFTTLASAQAGGATVRGMVTDGSKQAIGGAAVYLVPSSDVEKLAKSPVDRKRNSANDEPMEDNLATNRDKYKKAMTDRKGSFSIPKVANGKYFVYAEPSDTEHLPGGSLANTAMTTAQLAKAPLKIVVSGKSPENADFVGSSQCLACHTDYESIKKTKHKLGINVVGKSSKLQDPSRFPAMNEGLNKLMAGTTFHFYGFDKGRGFDKYLVSEKAPADPASVSFSATFFKDTDGKLKFRTKNARDSADPERTYTVEMTYGGSVHKQRYLYRVGDHLYPFLQYNNNGKDEFNDRTRKQWRDYHADWLYNEGTKKLANPPLAKSFELECASCHYTGYRLSVTVGGNYVADAVNDPNGEADIDGDGTPNELNIGCEVCHGPGSVHVRSSSAKKAATIVNPGKLASERSTVVCNQCHSRPQGYLKNDQPVNKDNRMLTPGTSRNDYLVNYTTREDAAQNDLWGDGLHSKGHHQQGTDFIRSKHYLNGNRILGCYNCHEVHGKTEVKHQLKAEVRDGKNSLCATCHKNVSVKPHSQQKVGFEHDIKISCVDCHMTMTMQTGAGYGKGLVTKEGQNYWMNDITSHLFTVPRKDNKAVKGVDPGRAMPIPYTNACGTCHDAESLKR
ncbi:MAG TPA: cytochrome c3 family protein [Burkholderiales bacterium]|nr:cytochrome c3 family protein [Burkholderiales bacterium]